jgi:hypothetical protein
VVDYSPKVGWPVRGRETKDMMGVVACKLSMKQGIAISQNSVNPESIA